MPSTSSTHPHAHQRRWPTAVWGALGLWIAANLADQLATLALLAHGHIGEGNPLMAALLTHWGLAGFIGYKLVATLAGVLLTLVGVKRDPRLALWALLGVDAVMLAVAGSNVWLLMTWASAAPAIGCACTPLRGRREAGAALVSSCATNPPQPPAKPPVCRGSSRGAMAAHLPLSH